MWLSLIRQTEHCCLPRPLKTSPFSKDHFPNKLFRFQLQTGVQPNTAGCSGTVRSSWTTFLSNTGSQGLKSLSIHTGNHKWPEDFKYLHKWNLCYTNYFLAPVLMDKMTIEMKAMYFQSNSILTEVTCNNYINLTFYNRIYCNNYKKFKHVCHEQDLIQPNFCLLVQLSKQRM